MNRAKKIINCFFIILVVNSLQACHSNSSGKAIRLSQVRSELPNTKIIEKQLTRAQLEDALSHEDLTRLIRIVEIFERDRPIGVSQIHEYRLFNIHPQSVFALLGLENADLLVAVDDFVVASPAIFQHFVRLLPGEQKATIEVRREGVPTLIKYEIK